MIEQPLDPQAAAALFRMLRDRLSDDPVGHDVLAQFERDPEVGAQGLADYLNRRLNSDTTFARTLAEAPGLPTEIRTIITGGQVDRIIQIAQAGTVIISPPAVRRSHTRALAIAGGLLALVVSLLAYYLLMVRPMGDGFNIAVAQFAMLDARGRLMVTDQSQKISGWLFSALQESAKQLPPYMRRELRGPEKIGVIDGHDQAARASAAEEVALRHNATVLIYGVVISSTMGYQVVPEFYVADQTFGYGSEVAGPNRLGQPVTFTLPLQSQGQARVNQELYARTEALQHVVLGLGQFFFGYYDKAWAEFDDAATSGPDEGKDVIYMLMGAAKLRAYDKLTNPAQRSQALIQASEAFSHSYQLNDRYARSYLGLGAVAREQARENPQQAQPLEIEAKLIEASRWYSASLSALDQPPSAYVPVKAAFGLGQVHILGSARGLPGWSADQAQRWLDQVIAAYDAKPVRDLAWFAGQAHADLGQLASMHSDWETMSSECRAGVKILGSMPNPPAKQIAFYWSYIAIAEERQQHIEDARKAYDKAIEFGTGSVAPEFLQTWKNKRDSLGQGLQ